MSQPTDPPSSSPISSLSSYVDGLLQTMVSSIATPEEVTPIPLLPEYVVSNIDGLYSLPFPQLVGLCDKLGIEHADCRIKYHIVSRIKTLEPKLHLLQYALMPPIPEKTLVDQYRYQLLSFDGAPCMVSREKAYNMTLSLLQSQLTNLPHQFGDVVVVDFGVVVNQAGFYTSTCLYPINYHAQKVYASVFNPKEDITYDCWIKESQGQPLFVISFEGSIVYYDWNINSVWNMLRNRIYDLRCQQGETKGRRPSMDVGEEFYGLTNRLVQLYLESQPMSLQCPGYIFVSQRNFLGRAGEIIQQEAALNKLQAEYVDLRARIIRFCTDREGVAPAQTTLETAANKCREILCGSRVLERLKRDEWSERDERLTQRNLEICEQMKTAREQKALEAEVLALNARKAFRPQKKPVPLLPKIYITRNSVQTGALALVEPTPTLQPSEPAPRPSKRASTRQSAVQPPVKREKATQRRQMRKKCLQLLAAEEERPRKRKRSSRECFSVDVHLRLVRELTENKQQMTSVVSVPPLSEETPSLPSPQPFSLLPATLTGDALALWDCLCFFRPVFQLPRVSYEAFEFSLAYPQLSDVLDQQMAMVLTLVFSQLRATLALSERSLQLSGWKPFQGRACTTATWPEFARLAFVCKTWVLSGSDAATAVRSFFEDGKHSVDEVTVADPLATPTTKSVGRKRQFRLVDPATSRLPLCEKEIVSDGDGNDAASDYRGRFDPSAIRPPFIDPDLADERSLFRLSSQQRFRRLAMELATRHPRELSVTMRFAVVSAILELARDTPPARQFLSLARKSVEASRLSVSAAQQEQLVRIRSVCRSLTESVSDRRRRRVASEKPVGKSRLRERSHGNWTPSEEETLEKAVDELGEGHWGEIAASFALALRYRSAAGRIGLCLACSDSGEVDGADARPRAAVCGAAALRRHHDSVAGRGDAADGGDASHGVSGRFPVAARGEEVDRPHLRHRVEQFAGACVCGGKRGHFAAWCHADGGMVACSV